VVDGFLMSGHFSLLFLRSESFSTDPDVISQLAFEYTFPIQALNASELLICIHTGHQ
jgi:hypothetical protein